MEEEKASLLLNSLPSFARGSDILLVNSNTLEIHYLRSMLRQCSFKVTVTNQASAAIDMICQQQGKFKLVMAKAKMPDMSTLSFLASLIYRKIPIIFISSGEDDAVARAAVAKGLCYFLEEPIKPDDLICVMQQVYGPQKKPANMYPNECFTKELQELEEKEKEKQNSTQHRREVRSKKRKKRQRVRSKVAEHNNGESSNKKPRFVWTPDLHHKFVQAVLVLGDQSSSRPKEIKQLMNVPELTCTQIASHLQKFKSQVKILEELLDLASLSASESLNLSDGTTSSLNSDNPAGFHTLASLQNMNQKENPIPIDSVEPVAPQDIQLQESNDCGNEDLYSVVGLSAPYASKNNYQNLEEHNNNVTQILGEDCDKDDEASQASKVLKNFTFGNSSNISQHTSGCNTSYVSPLKINPPETVLEFDSGALTAQNQTVTAYSNSLVESLFRKKPYEIAQNYETQTVPDALTNHQDQNLTEFDKFLRSFDEDFEGYGSFLEELLHDTTEISEIVSESNLGNSLKDKPDALIYQTENVIENDNVLRSLGVDCEGQDHIALNSYGIANNTEIPMNSIVGKNLSVQEATMAAASLDQDLTLEDYIGDIKSFLGGDFNGYDIFGNEPSPDDLDDMLNNYGSWEISGAQLSNNINTSRV